MEDGTINHLPQEITLNLLSRLPADSVLDCKAVCRSWRHLIRFHTSTIYFAYEHLEHQHGRGLTHKQEQNLHGSDPTMMSFVLFDDGSQALYYAEYHEEQQPVYHRRRFNLEFPVRMFSVVGSCNGLICLSAPTNYEGLRLSNKYGDSSHSVTYPASSEPSYICNPVTREFVNLPAICMDKMKSKKGVRITFGFGYHPQTNVYKVVRVSYVGASYKLPPVVHEKKLAPRSGLVEIYTLGSGSEWRSLEETRLFLENNYFGGSVCLNGSLHWLQEESREIVAFDLAHEDFHLIPTPPPCRSIKRKHRRRLCVIRSCLCLVYEYYGPYNSPEAFDLWLFKENEVVESITSYQKTMQPYDSRSWSKEYSIKWTVKKDRIALDRLFALTKGREILVRCDTDDIVRYNLNTETTTKVWVPKDVCKWFQMVPLPHINTFVSLKALGEETAELYKESTDEDDTLVSSGTRREAKRFKSAAETSQDQ